MLLIQKIPLPGVYLMLALPFAVGANAAVDLKFDFGTGVLESGYTQVSSSSSYSPEVGFGFVDSVCLDQVINHGDDALRGDVCVSDQPFTFAVDLPEGNYDVTVLLGDPNDTSSTTVKAEARRLMIENVTTAMGAFQSYGFTVNVRTPQIASGGEVILNSREKGPPLSAHWDGQLTLEFLGEHVSIAAMQVKSAPDAVTVFIAGDSTVTDQPHEPWAGWGQMLPRFFEQGVAVSNHAESGRALFSFRWEHRLDKILGMLQRGDYVLIQFGHNDQKNKKEGAGPFTTYAQDLQQYIEVVRAGGGIPVLVSPMERRRWSGGRPQETLTDFAQAVRQVGAAERVAVIDLHAMSLELYTALGQEGSTQAFVHYPAHTYAGQDQRLKDDTHHNVYGAYQLARCVVEGIRSEVPALAKHLRADVDVYDPAQPQAVEAVNIPDSPIAGVEKPEGN